jgi:hypothetical protein
LKNAVGFTDFQWGDFPLGRRVGYPDRWPFGTDAEFPVTCVGRRLAVQVRRAIPSIRPLEPQDVFQAEYTED